MIIFYMKIALIKQQTGYEIPCDYKEYLHKVIGVLQKTNADIIAGPELAISNGYMPINKTEFNSFCSKISDSLNGNLVVPGTALVFNRREKWLRNIAPVITKNRVLFHSKKSSVNEDNIAKNYQLEYQTGEKNEGIYYHNGVKVGIEICRDHSLGKLRNLDSQVDIQLILACDLMGISPNNLVIKPEGIIGFVDGKMKDSGLDSYFMKKGRAFYFPNREEHRDYSLTEINQ